ncbi:unnamed protein product, partial [Effrenium voratum]
MSDASKQPAYSGLTLWVGLTPEDADKIFVSGEKVMPHWGGRWGLKPTPVEALLRCQQSDLEPDADPKQARIHEISFTSLGVEQARKVNDQLQNIGEGYFRFYSHLEREAFDSTGERAAVVALCRMSAAERVRSRGLCYVHARALDAPALHSAMVLSRLISKKLESFEMEVREKESTQNRMPLSGVVKMTFASSTGRIALEDEVCFVGEGAFKRVMVCKKYPLALKFTLKVGAAKQSWPHHCLKEPEVFDQASTCHDLMVAYFGGVFLDGDWSRTLRGSARTPATDVGSVTIAERACEVSETVARQQWMQACTSTLLRLHLKMQL